SRVRRPTELPDLMAMMTVAAERELRTRRARPLEEPVMRKTITVRYLDRDAVPHGGGHEIRLAVFGPPDLHVGLDRQERRRDQRRMRDDVYGHRRDEPAEIVDDRFHDFLRSRGPDRRKLAPPWRAEHPVGKREA